MAITLFDGPDHMPVDSISHGILVVMEGLGSFDVSDFPYRIDWPLAYGAPGQGLPRPRALLARRSRAGEGRPAGGLTAPPRLWLALAVLRRAVRLCGCAAAPVAIAAGVSVGHVRWVGVWARALEGRAARGAEWDGRWDGMAGEGSGMGARMGDLRGSCEQWDGRASGFDGALSSVGGLRARD
jgi:hypothetical protein